MIRRACSQLGVSDASCDSARLLFWVKLMMSLRLRGSLPGLFRLIWLAFIVLGLVYAAVPSRMVAARIRDSVLLCFKEFPFAGLQSFLFIAYECPRQVQFMGIDHVSGLQ